MQTLKLLFSKITDDNPIYEKKDVVENIFVFRILLIWHLLYTFVFILNCLNIFIVDNNNSDYLKKARKSGQITG